MKNIILENKKLRKENEELKNEITSLNGQLTNYMDKIFNNVVSKQKVKDVIEKYFMEYEKEKEYRFTDDVEAEQEILISIENEILEENYDI